MIKDSHKSDTFYPNIKKSLFDISQQFNVQEINESQKR